MSRFVKKCLAVGVAATAVVAFLGVVPADASDIASFETQFATDVVYAGIGGMRGGGTGTITVAGVSGSVTKAYLYWHGPTNSADPASNASVTVEGTDVTGTNIGTSDNNCWGFTNSQAYRADVTSIVTGNGAYDLTNMRKTTPAVADVNGATMVVFFDDGNDANNRDVVLFDGNDSNIDNAFDAPGWNVSLPGINYASGSAALDLVYSDTQVFNDSGLRVNDTQVSDPGVVLNGSTVPNAGGTGLWDNKSYDITTLLTPGDNTVTLTLASASGDCISLVVAAVNLPAGAAPNQPSTTTTTAAVAPTTTAAPAAEVEATPAFTG